MPIHQAWNDGAVIGQENLRASRSRQLRWANLDNSIAFDEDIRSLASARRHIEQLAATYYTKALWRHCTPPLKRRSVTDLVRLGVPHLIYGERLLPKRRQVNHREDTPVAERT